MSTLTWKVLTLHYPKNLFNSGQDGLAVSLLRLCHNKPNPMEPAKARANLDIEEGLVFKSTFQQGEGLMQQGGGRGAAPAAEL